MSTQERIFHSILFEVIALSLLIPLGSFFSDLDMSSVTGLAVVLSLTAMCWNYVYNLIFDKHFGTNRIERSFFMRMGHATVFELGLLIVTLPLIMWMFDMDFITALILDIGMIIFFIIYAIVYNWCYDITKHKLVVS
ncbi:PACE efflux transporter [Colwellia piezophila]|uniref:PACE efflux transporter n=1 Tax=Colwellia piezophila TaxID=211668 RepID=UPI00037E6E8F|nr:PACE efflux transporter [Colwellia piezophila]